MRIWPTAPERFPPRAGALNLDATMRRRGGRKKKGAISQAELGFLMGTYLLRATPEEDGSRLLRSMTCKKVKAVEQIVFQGGNGAAVS